MPKAPEKLKKSLIELPPEQRLAIAEYLISSVERDDDSEWDARWMRELNRRWADVESGKDKGVPGPAAMKRAYRALEKVR